MDAVKPVTLRSMGKSRQRMIFEFPDRLQRAIRMRAGLENVRVTEMVQAILEKEFASELEVADKVIASEAKKPKK